MTSIVLVRLSAMGDLLQSLGAVRSLREAVPDVRVTMVTQRSLVPLLDGLPGIDEVVPFDRRGGVRAVLAVRRALRRVRHDWALDLQGNWKSALLTRLAGARRCVGMGAGWRQEPASRVLLREAVHCDAVPHPARAAWELVRRVAANAPFCVGRLVASAAELERERAHLARLGVDGARPFRVVVVTDESDPRALPAAVRASAARDAPGPVVHLLGPDERALPDPEGIVVRHAAGELRRLVALGALLAQAGGDVVGPDQGATHVLLASGAAGHVLFGSQDPRRTAPPTARARVGAEELACRPCRSSRCRLPGGAVCMAGSFPKAWTEVDVGLPRDGERADVRAGAEGGVGEPGAARAAGENGDAGDVRR